MLAQVVVEFFDDDGGSLQQPTPFVGDLDGLHPTVVPTALPAHGADVDELVNQRHDQARGDTELRGDLTLGARQSGVDDGEQSHLLVGQTGALNTS